MLAHWHASFSSACFWTVAICPPSTVRHSSLVFSTWLSNGCGTVLIINNHIRCMYEWVRAYIFSPKEGWMFFLAYVHVQCSHTLSLSYTPNVLVRLLSSRLQCDSAKGSSYLRWFSFCFFLILDRNRMIKIETTKRDEAMSGMVLTNN